MIKSPYTGLLDEPLELSTPLGLSLDVVHPMYLALGFPAEEWPALLKASWRGDAEKMIARRRALFDHFGVNPEAPYADIDLALCLAYRHERDTLMNGEHVSLGALCALFETTDPNQLVWKLAAQHVRGFQRAEPKRSRRRLTSTEWVEIFFAVIVVGDRLGELGGRVSDRARLDAAIRELTELARMRLRKDGRRQIIEVNPALVEVKP
jgi:hypothetical protein